jgi:glycolate oxidase iron-sulfur subunit
MKQSGVVEQVLTRAGIDLAQTRDKHLCCGSAGTYSVLQPEMSQKLLDNKLKALTIDNPSRIVTANIGCQLHLETKAQVPVQHWIELLDR